MEAERWNLVLHPTISHNSNKYVLLYRFEILRGASASMPLFLHTTESSLRWGDIQWLILLRLWEYKFLTFLHLFSYKTMWFYSTGSKCFEKQELLCHSFHLPKKAAVFEKVRFRDSFDASFLMQILFGKPLKSCISLEKLELLCLSFCLSKRAVYGEMRFSDSFAATSLMHISNFPIFLI